MLCRLVPLLAFALVACQSSSPERVPAPVAMDSTSITHVHAFSGWQLTGIAATRAPDGSTRLFVNFPRWHGETSVSVAELLPDNILRPYPDGVWNSWRSDHPQADVNAPYQWVCVQSVWADETGDLWVLDPGSPSLAGVVPGAPKLVRIDTGSNRVQRVYRFDETIAPKESYLNDVRVDRAARRAYITDSGRPGIVVLNLDTGKARRVLDNHPATRADPSVVPIVEGRELRFAGGDNKGAVPQIHSDGLALDTRGGYLYWQPLTGRRLFRIRTSILTRDGASDAQIANAVEDLGRTVVSDGMELGPSGEVLFTALEKDAIVAREPGGALRTVVQSPLLAWPDSLAFGPDGFLYITVSQIHRTAWFSEGGVMPTSPYLLVKIPYAR